MAVVIYLGSPVQACLLSFLTGEKCISGRSLKWFIRVPLGLDSTCDSDDHSSTSCLYVLMSGFGNEGGGLGKAVC